MSVTGKKPIGLLPPAQWETGALTIWECADCKALINDIPGHVAWHTAQKPGGPVSQTQQDTRLRNLVNAVCDGDFGNAFACFTDLKEARDKGAPLPRRDAI